MLRTTDEKRRKGSDGVGKPTDWQTDRQTGGQVDRQTRGQGQACWTEERTRTDRRTGEQANGGKPTCRWADERTGADGGGWISVW